MVNAVVSKHPILLTLNRNRNGGLLGWEASEHFFAGLEEEKIKEKKCFLIGLFPWKKLIFFSQKKTIQRFFFTSGNNTLELGKPEHYKKP